MRDQANCRVLSVKLFKRTDIEKKRTFIFSQIWKKEWTSTFLHNYYNNFVLQMKIPHLRNDSVNIANVNLG